MIITATDVADQATTFSITDTKLYVPIIILSTRDNAKLFGQLESGFKRITKQNKYQPNVSTKRPNQYLNFLIDPGFQPVNRLFVLSLKDEAQRTSDKGYYLLNREIKL